jgi:hypothetical protein
MDVVRKRCLKPNQPISQCRKPTAREMQFPVLVCKFNHLVCGAIIQRKDMQPEHAYKDMRSASLLPKTASYIHIHCPLTLLREYPWKWYGKWHVTSDMDTYCKAVFAYSWIRRKLLAYCDNSAISGVNEYCSSIHSSRPLFGSFNAELRTWKLMKAYDVTLCVLNAFYWLYLP